MPSLQTTAFVDDSGNKVFATPVVILGGVAAPSDLPLVTSFYDYIVGPGVVAVRKNIPLTNGIKRLNLAMFQIGSVAPTNMGIWVLINALSDGDANLRLGLTEIGGRTLIPLGRNREFNFDDTSPLLRLDVIGTTTTAEAANAGFAVIADYGF